MASDRVQSPSLPPTVASRRNARLKQGALSSIPIWLFLLAASVRLWEPDLAPFGVRQAEYVSAASSRAPISWFSLYADPTVTPLMLAEPVLRQLPAPILVWVILRGLVDSLGVVLLFLAARPFVSVWGATLVALLYAVNPTTWAAARDPAGPLTAVLMAAALCMAVRVVQRPTIAHGAILGLALGLLARSGPPDLLVVCLGAVTLVLGRASWRVGGVTALALVVCAGPAILLLVGLDLSHVGTYVALALPGWIVYGLAYQPPEGQAVGTTFLAWRDSAFVVLMAVLLIAGVGIVASAVRRAPLAAQLPVLWSGLAWLGAALALQRAERMGDPSHEVFLVPEPAAMLALAPLVLVVVVLPMVAPWRLARWWGGLGGLVLFTLSFGMVGLSTHNIAQTAAEGGRLAYPPSHWRAPGLDAMWAIDGRPLANSWKAPATLRAWTALANAASETAARADADEIVIPGLPYLSIDVLPLRSLLRDQLRVRQPTVAAVLPLERETIFVVSTDPGAADRLTPHLRRPLSSTPVYDSIGIDTGVRLLTLRPRPPADWLSRARLVTNGQFADGSTLLAIGTDGSEASRDRVPGGKTLLLYWQLPTTPRSETAGQMMSSALRGTPKTLFQSSALMRVSDRRDGELVVVQIHVGGVPDDPRGADISDGSLVVWLSDFNFERIPTVSGADELVIPLTSAP